MCVEQIIVECLVSLITGCYGVCLLSGRFVPMLAARALSAAPFDTMFHPPDFLGFNHRAKAIAAIKATG